MRIQFDLWVCYLCKHELLRRLTISEEWEYIDFIYWKLENQVHLIYPENEEKKMNETNPEKNEQVTIKFCSKFWGNVQSIKLTVKEFIVNEFMVNK